MRLLVVGHDAGLDGVLSEAGHLVAWAAGRGVGLVPQVPADLPADDRLDADGVVVLGSEESAADDALPWLAGELAFVRGAHEAGVPVLGICFGGQLLARALGGAVGPSPEPEHGWLRVRPLAGAEAAGVVEGPWMQFHGDAFTPPPGAQLLAETDVCPQAFRAGRSVGLQFHPELDERAFDTWVAGWERTGYVDELPDAGLSLAGLRRDVAANAALSRPRAHALFDAWIGAGADVDQLAGRAPEDGSR